jgi:hypothetical protein
VRRRAAADPPTRCGPTPAASRSPQPGPGSRGGWPGYSTRSERLHLFEQI